MSVNGKVCWTKSNLIGTTGTQLCGGFYKEQRFRVLGCQIMFAKAQDLTVRVWTNLDGDATDESFGIDNVLITKSLKFHSEFDNPNDLDGWDCGVITTCGDHQICGGYNVKGKDSDITKTFMVPAGTYYVELDFIKIDSWCVCVCIFVNYTALVCAVSLELMFQAE